MKTYSVLNEAPCHEYVRGSGGIAPRIINFDIKGEWVIITTTTFNSPYRHIFEPFHRFSN